MVKQSLKFSIKFYWGIFLVVSSLIIGFIVKLIWILFSNQLSKNTLWLSIIIYVISWPMLIVGGWWVGKEYFDKIKKYASYKFYHEHLKKSSKKVYHKTRKLSGHVKNKLRNNKKMKISKDINKNMVENTSKD